VVDVEGQSHRDPAALRFEQRPGDELGGRLLEIEVVQGEVEALARARNELGRPFGDLEGGLPAVGEGSDLDQA
jgi:hypothetical protein